MPTWTRKHDKPAPKPSKAKEPAATKKPAKADKPVVVEKEKTPSVKESGDSAEKSEDLKDGK